jgi:hypothetical protein
MIRAVFFILFGICLLVNGRPLVTAVEQFTADFVITTQYNASFNDDNIPGYHPVPFLQSPTVSPIRGKIWFDYNTYEVRIDITNGDGSPWKLATTVIANSFNFSYDEFTFNCTTNLYWTAGPNRCWYGNMQNLNVPIQMGGGMNLTYNGTRQVDGYDCMVFSSNTGYLYVVRLLDLALVEVDLPYFIGTLAPYFDFFGFGNALTRVMLTNIVTGPPDPSNFNIPTGACIQIWNDSTVDHENLGDRPLENLIPNPVADIVEEVAKKTIFRDFQEPQPEPEPRKSIFTRKKRSPQQNLAPHLNQTYSANWVLNANSPNAPYTPYTLSGTLGFDFTKSGFYITLDAVTGNIPFDLQVGFHIYPDRNGIEFLQLSPDGSCYSYLYLQWLWTYLIPVYEVPWTSTYTGTARVNGDTCTVWKTTWNWYDNAAVLYVRESDHVIVQSLVPDPVSFSPSLLTFSNVQGTVNPSGYGRPSTCSEMMNWSPDFESHLPWDWCGLWCAL